MRSSRLSDASSRHTKSEPAGTSALWSLTTVPLLSKRHSASVKAYGIERAEAPATT